jgi:hypothetical protein
MAIIATDILQTEVTKGEKDSLIEFMHDHTTYDCSQQKWILIEINNCETMDEYEKVQHRLVLNQIEDKDKAPMGLTCLQRDINATIKSMNRNSKP